MKNTFLSIATLFVLISITPNQIKAGTLTKTSTNATGKTPPAEAANALLTRLFEINGLDKSALNTSEKKEMRKEVRSIRDDLKKLDGGIYLSVGAIIIILLILILLL